MHASKLVLSNIAPAAARFDIIDQRLVGISMQKRQTIIITGWNPRLGFAWAKEILVVAPYLHVVIDPRDAKRASAAVEELQQLARQTGASVEAMMLDLASLAWVRDFATELEDRIPAPSFPIDEGYYFCRLIPKRAVRILTRRCQSAVDPIFAIQS